MPNPFTISDLDALSIDRLIAKAAEYKGVMEASRGLQSPTITRIVQNVQDALEEIETEIEWRRGLSTFAEPRRGKGRRSL